MTRHRKERTRAELAAEVVADVRAVLGDRTVDRTNWPPGPWDAEGDEERWTTRAGFVGVMMRNQSGAWCGYVLQRSGDPLYDTNCQDAPALEVHGGLTYSGFFDDHSSEWAVGFDCAHAADLMPAFVDRGLLSHGVYRDRLYVHGEVEALAEQIAKLR